MDAAARYAERLDAVNTQLERVAGATYDNRWDRMASAFTMDPHRDLDPNLAIVAEYVRPDDVIVDVGGGAGRVSLPLALRAREVIDVDPSPGMCAAFETSARDAGITNARAIQSAWPAEGVAGDLVLVFNVTYFVRDIVPFVEALQHTARRRVMIGVWSVPPPAQDLALFELVHGEPGESVPSHRELLPVLWEMGILPDVRVLPNDFRFPGALPQSKEAAIDFALDRLAAKEKERPRSIVTERFDELFTQSEAGYRSRWRPSAREMLITWETPPVAP
ncbi:MAG: methyltransferase domain-containing protein [Dehalococcoidia bacterium]